MSNNAPGPGHNSGITGAQLKSIIEREVEEGE